MIAKIRTVFGAWLGLWILVPAIIVLTIAAILNKANDGMLWLVRRYDAHTKRALAGLDDWIKYGREPME